MSKQPRKSDWDEEKKQYVYPKKKCRYCKLFFRPVRATQDFCCAAHRKSFHAYGCAPLGKIEKRMETYCRKFIREEVAAIIQEEIEKRMKPVQGVVNRDRKELVEVVREEIFRNQPI